MSLFIRSQSSLTQIEPYGSFYMTSPDERYDFSSPVDDFDQKALIIEEIESKELKSIVEKHLSYLPKCTLLPLDLPKYTPPVEDPVVSVKVEKKEKKKKKKKKKNLIIKLKIPNLKKEKENKQIKRIGKVKEREKKVKLSPVQKIEKRKRKRVPPSPTSNSSSTSCSNSSTSSSSSHSSFSGDKLKRKEPSHLHENERRDKVFLNSDNNQKRKISLSNFVPTKKRKISPGNSIGIDTTRPIPRIKKKIGTERSNSTSSVKTSTKSFGTNGNNSRAFKVFGKREKGREIKHEAQEIFKKKPRKGSEMYVLAGLEFVMDAENLVAHNMKDRALKYYETNISYLNQIEGVMKNQAEVLKQWIGLSMVLSGYCALRSYCLSMETLKSTTTFILDKFQYNKPINDELRQETCKYIHYTSRIIEALEKLEKSKKYLGKNLLPSPLHSKFFFTQIEDMVEYVRSSLKKMI